MKMYVDGCRRKSMVIIEMNEKIKREEIENAKRKEMEKEKCKNTGKTKLITKENDFNEENNKRDGGKIGGLKRKRV
jgi:hypothetical protein